MTIATPRRRARCALLGASALSTLALAPALAAAQQQGPNAVEEVIGNALIPGSMVAADRRPAP